jgi:hypothetical protein
MEGQRYVAVSNPERIGYSRNVGCDEPKRKDDPGGTSAGCTKSFLAGEARQPMVCAGFERNK